ncbi:MAG: hypothetical protein HKN25_03105, partial [Pyrinomonadaceae bacterium]|nr:hypothetical protein [Pyrinomonadaceae bacterium]
MTFDSRNKTGKLRKLCVFALLVAFHIAALAQDNTPVFKGQPPVKPVDTTTKPIERQKRQVFSFESDGVYFSNDFDGARLNEIEQTDAGKYTITI